MQKNNLLITFSAHMFKEVITPLIYDLQEQYNITVTVFDLNMPDELSNELAELKKENLIRNYFIIPSKSILNQLLFLKTNTKNINDVNYDFWITHQEFQTYELFIQYYVLPKHCKKIVLAQGISHLLSDKYHIAKELLSLEPNSTIESNENSNLRMTLCKKVILKIEDSGGWLKFVFNIARMLIIRQIHKLKRIFKHIQRYNHRYFLPMIFFGKIFKNEYYDDITQMGSGRSDYYLFLDDLTAKAHAKLYGSSKVRVVSYPTIGNCHCSSKEGNKHIISPLSGQVGVDTIPYTHLKLYLRDFTILKKHIEGDMVLHLRKHPRETGRWPFQLRDYLRENDLNAEVVDTKRSIWEIMCNYRGMAGLCSTALVDARLCCDHAFIIAFEAVSRFRYKDPKFVYGSVEGIEWINDDGTYEPSIFENKKFSPPQRQTIPEFLNSIQ